MNNIIVNFWNKEKDKILWSKKPKKLLKFKSKGFLWFDDGKLNVAENCIKKNLDKNLGKKNAIHYIKENGEEYSFTYNDLSNLVFNFSLFLKKKNKSSGPIFIHSSASIEASISMLSAAKLGIKHCVIFEELEDEAISKRLELINPGIVITKTSNIKKITYFKKAQKIQI